MKKGISSVYRVVLSLATISLLAPNPIQAQDFEPSRARIQRALVEERVPSVAVAVAMEGKIVWEEGFGWADREKRIPATQHTMYSLASISKPITATGLMILVERGLVDLDHPVNDYLGSAKLRGRAGDASRATVRRVANHTSGLGLHYQFFYEDEPYQRPAMDESIRRYGNLVTAPGERYQYSNFGFGVLDYVISRVSGKSYPDFMREEVFLPLGLTRTSVHIGPGLEGFEAVRYARDGTPIPFYDFDHPGASAVYASAHDLVRFGMFHLKNRLPDQRRILSDKAIDRMAAATVETGNGGRRGYGIGWATGRHSSGLKTIGHGGGMGGVSTTLTLLPEKNAVVVVLLNSRGPSRAISNQILSDLFPRKADRPGSGNSGSGSSPGSSASVFEPNEELLGRWKGTLSTYEKEIGLELVVKKSGDIHARLQGQLWTLVNNPVFRDGFLRGRMAGDLGTEDVNRTRYHLALELKLRGNQLNGAVIAMSRHTPNRVRNALTHWAELTRE